MEILRDIDLSVYSSWKVGGKADWYCTPSTLDEIKEAMSFAKSRQLPLVVLSGGTNVLISDRGVRGLVLHLRKWTGVETRIDGNPKRLTLTAKSGTAKSELLKIFLKNELEPAVFLAGIPGDVGGGIVMNAGVGEAIRPREFVEIVDWIEVLRDGKLIRIQRDDLNWSYRHCNGWQPGVIVNIEMSWSMTPHPEILAVVRDANQARLKKQPLEWPSCGSVFVNPPRHKAGQMIEECGLRGYTVGDACVSDKHANFIVNKGAARASDIHAIIEHVKAEVLSKTGIKLHTEVVYLGEWDRE